MNPYPYYQMFEQENQIFLSYYLGLIAMVSSAFMRSKDIQLSTALQFEQLMNGRRQSQKRLIKALDFALQSVKQKWEGLISSLSQRADDLSESTIGSIEDDLCQFVDSFKNYFDVNLDAQTVENRTSLQSIDSQLFAMKVTNKTLKIFLQDCKQFALSILSHISSNQLDRALYLIVNSLKQLREQTIKSLRAMGIRVLEALNRSSLSDKISSQDCLEEQQMHKESESELIQSKITLFSGQQESGYRLSQFEQIQIDGRIQEDISSIFKSDQNPPQTKKLKKKKIKENQTQTNEPGIEDRLIRKLKLIEGANKQIDQDLFGERENADGIESQSNDNDQPQKQVFQLVYSTVADLIDAFEFPRIEDTQRLLQLKQKVGHIAKQMNQCQQRSNRYDQQGNFQFYLQEQKKRNQQFLRMSQEIKRIENKTVSVNFEQVELIMEFGSSMGASIQLNFGGGKISDQKNRKKKDLYLRSLELRMIGELRLNTLKYKHFRDIVQMKKKYSKIKNTLFKEDLQVLWLFKLTDEEIQAKVMECDHSQLNELKTEWREQLQKRSCKTDEFCFKHKSQIFYLCLNEIQKEKIYLCNKCMEDKEHFSSHQNHEIICKRHRKTINNKLVSKQLLAAHRSKQTQFYLCKYCLFYNPQKYVFISNCHYQTITSLCIQQSCIKDNKFMVCPICQAHENKHELHRRVNFDKQTLMEKLAFQSEIDISKYQQQYTKVEDMFRLNAFQKVMNSYAQQICLTLRFLKSFAVYNNKEVEKWVDQFMKGGKREDLIVLRGVLKMNQVKYNEVDRLNYLEALIILMGQELQGMFKNIWERVKQCCKKIRQLSNITEEEVNTQLNQRYAQIMDIEIEDQVILFPMKLIDVNPIHYHRIQKITVKKQREQQSDQKIKRDWREARRMFFTNQIRNKLNQIQEEQKRQLIQLFLEAKQWNYYLKIDLDQLGQLSKHKSLIQSIIQSYRRMNKQLFQKRQRECLVFTQIVSNQFTNLRTVHIQYQHSFQSIQMCDYDYSISAFEIFKFIAANPQLLQLNIKAVKMQQMKSFLQLLSPKYKHLQKTQQQQRDLSWMSKFQQNLPRSLKLIINAEIIFEFGNKKDNYLSMINDFSYFISLFLQVSDIAVHIKQFDTNSIVDWENVLNELLLTLAQIKNIKIVIIYCDDLSFKYLLSKLSLFTDINSLQFQGINVNRKVDNTDLLTIQESLKKIFSSNNKLTHLKLDNCSNFPVLPPITTLQSIDLRRAQLTEKFCLNEFIKASKSLRSVTCNQIEQKLVIEQELLNQLEILWIYQCKNICFGVVSSSSPSSLKDFSIDKLNVSPQCLKTVFPKLVKITNLRLSNIDFGYQLLSLIPSLHLECLSIKYNDQITNRCLQLIDSKWPYIKKIQLIKCSKVTEKFLSLCKFKSLMQLRLSYFKLTPLARQYLKIRGFI